MPGAPVCAGVEDLPARGRLQALAQRLEKCHGAGQGLLHRRARPSHGQGDVEVVRPPHPACTRSMHPTHAAAALAGSRHCAQGVFVHGFLRRQQSPAANGTFGAAFLHMYRTRGAPSSTAGSSLPGTEQQAREGVASWPGRECERDKSTLSLRAPSWGLVPVRLGKG